MTSGEENRRQLHLFINDMRFIIIVLFIGVQACGQDPGSKKNDLDLRAKQLVDSAMFIAMQTENYHRAIALLDQATQLDSNYLMAYGNKIIFQMELKLFDEALVTSRNLLRINPNAPEHYGNFGMIYECKGDTVLSKKYFSEAARKYDAILDTMSTADKQYNLYLMNKAINLVLLGEQMRGNEILHKLYVNEEDGIQKELIGLFINKSKREIFDYLLQRN